MFRWPEPGYWPRILPDLQGQRDLHLASVSSLSRPTSHSIIFANQLSDASTAALAQCTGCLLLLPESSRETAAPLEDLHGVSYSEEPRYAFAYALQGLWSAQSWRDGLTWDSSVNATLGNPVHIDPTAVIEPGATISSHCVIGPECYIMSGARLGPRVVVGQGTVIRENAVVGGYGFGLARSAGKPTLRIPHFGGVQLGNDVEVGALTTVCSGTIDPTVIEDGVKIDDRVHIAHNCHLEPGVIVVAGTCISGSCRIGARTWFGPNSCTREKTTIGPDCLIGAGAVVLKSLEASQKVFGNPARTF